MRDSLSQVKPYRTPKTNGLGLQSNTNRLGPNPVNNRLAQLLENINLINYPDNETTQLRQALASRYGLDPASFLITNGSNEAYDLIYKTFLNPGETVVFPSPSFSMYPYYARTNAVDFIEIPLDEHFDLEAQTLLETAAELIILCSPNNPTGNELNAKAIEIILKSGRFVVIDEAYGEFADQHWIDKVKTYPNLMVTRTFSKAYGLAGLRVGYTAANPELIELLMKARLPYNVNALSQAVASAALQERGFVGEYVALIRAQRPLWSQALTERQFSVWPSQANFILAQVPQGVNRDELVENLSKAGVVVRSGGPHPRLSSCIRVTLGTPGDGQILFDAIDTVLS